MADSGEFRGIKIDGFKETRRRLKKAGDDLHEMRDLHRSIAKEIAEASKPRAPVGPTGNLRKSIRSSGTKTQAIVRLGSKKVRYANAIHWGRNMWPSQEATPRPPRSQFWAHIPRRAFIWDTMKDHATRIERQYAEFIKKTLEEEN